MTELNNISRSDVYRYMGFRDEIPEPHIREMTEDIIKELSQTASPRYLFAQAPVNISDNMVDFDSFKTISNDLSLHLTDCTQAVIFAATLGSSVDMLIYKYSMISPAKAVAAQAAAATMIEMYSDEMCDEILKSYSDRQLYLTPRYSPGYGDFSLEHQRDIIRVLKAEKTIGLCVTESDLLTPMKSITAIMGITTNKYECKDHKCECCVNSGCAYRKEKEV